MSWYLVKQIDSRFDHAEVVYQLLDTDGLGAKARADAWIVKFYPEPVIRPLSEVERLQFVPPRHGNPFDIRFKGTEL